MKELINYGNIGAGDVVMTGGNSIFGYFIKIITAGFFNRNNRAVATHVGIVVEMEGQKFIAEMLSDKIRFNSFDRYNGESKNRWIVGIVSHNRLSHQVRKEINREMALWFRRSSEHKYDWRGILGFTPLNIAKIRHCPDKWFCSEMVSYLWKKFGKIELPVSEEFVTPQMFNPLADIHIQGMHWIHWKA